MKAPFAQYAVEFFALIGCGLYISIRHYVEGIDIWNPKGDSKKKLLLNTIVSGIVSVILFALLSGIYDIKNLISYFVSFVATKNPNAAHKTNNTIMFNSKNYGLIIVLSY